MSKKDKITIGCMIGEVIGEFAIGWTIGAATANLVDGAKGKGDKALRTIGVLAMTHTIGRKFAHSYCEHCNHIFGTDFPVTETFRKID